MTEECGADCLRVGPIELIGFRTYSIALILVCPFVYLVFKGIIPTSALESAVTLVLGYMFGRNGTAQVQQAIKALR
jgi:hypothetical protein